MILISHRGNLYGKGGDYWENHPDYLNYALHKGFDVEIDVWLQDNQLFLGHDKPVHLIQDEFLFNNQNHLWCHAKNFEAMEFLLKNKLHCFWHENDKMTLTSKGIPWLYPGQNIIDNSIILKFEKNDLELDFITRAIIKGVCSDFIESFSNF